MKLSGSCLIAQRKHSHWALSALILAGAMLLLQPGSLAAQSTTVSVQSVPYSLPVAVPSPRFSPHEDPAAPYTPTVVSLIKQLEAHTPPTLQELNNAARLLTTQGGTYDHPEGSNPTCHNLANVSQFLETSPRIMPLCFSDGLGLNTVNGPNVGLTTGLPSMLVLASSFDRNLANAMGQLEGREGRNLMVTGLLGPQADTDVFINWGRGHHTPGEDPYLNGEITAAQINGIQGQGLMSQVKHFAVYFGADGPFTDVQDQALHEIYLTPYEAGLIEGGASSVMCSYQRFRDASPYLAQQMDLLAQPSPFPGASTKTWPLNEAHYSCENPLLLTYTLRKLWGSQAFQASDYGGVHSASSFLQGLDHEDPSETYLGGSNPEGREDGGRGSDLGLDTSGSSCANASGKPVACTEPGAVHVAGILGEGCPATGCGIAQAVFNGIVPLSVFNQALARILYQEERFGLLGCDHSSADCKNPGGIGADRSGLSKLVDGGKQGLPELGTKFGDAAITERVAEEGGVLLKNENQTLPIQAADLKRGIAVSGAGAEYLVANPNNEGAVGYSDRNAINPLEQLQALSGSPEAFTYTPAQSPSGQTVPCTVLSTQAIASAPAPSACTPASGLQRATGTSSENLRNERTDAQLDFTAVSPQGRLTGGKLYRWQGWIYIPAADSYTFRIEHSASVADSKVSFELDSSHKTLVDAISFYQGQYYGNKSVDVSPTNGGYTEAGLRNRQCAVEQRERYSVRGPVVLCGDSPSVGWHRVVLTLDATGVAASQPVSFRFAYSRVAGDIADAAAAAEGKALALVFVNDQGRNTVPNASPLSSLNPVQMQLIEAVAAKNPNTVVVLNTGTPIIVKEWIDNPNVKALLNMGHTGQEGGTATARLLLGQANPSGHVTITWPRDNNDTIQGYNQPQPLYPGDTAGTHPERLKGANDSASIENQGIYSGYRFYDQLGLPVQFPFGFGLSYSSFKYSALKLTAAGDGSVTVEFDLKNTGSVAGAAVPQVYVGAGKQIAGVQQAVRSLRGFERVSLDPGQSRHVTLTLDPRSFQYWSEPEQQWETNYGSRSIYVGEADAAAYLPLSASITLGKTTAAK